MLRRPRSRGGGGTGQPKKRRHHLSKQEKEAILRGYNNGVRQAEYQVEGGLHKLYAHLGRTCMGTSRTSEESNNTEMIKWFIKGRRRSRNGIARLGGPLVGVNNKVGRIHLGFRV